METVGSRLKFRRRQMKLTQKALSEYVGVTASAVTQWESDTTKLSAESLIQVCHKLNCSPDWLIFGRGDIEIGGSRISVPNLEVPVLSWVQAGNWTEVISDPSNEMVRTTRKLSGSAFALRVKGDSMTSNGDMSIPEGSIVVVEPEYGQLTDANGKIVIAQTIGSGEATIKKLQLDPPHAYLMPLNQTFRPIEVNENTNLIGVVKQIIIDLH